ncbi:MAG TPA: hypothetical protein VFF67_01945 [Thermoplasmata archaeon]|nr:hypothetical protein [Thermoplasmata archaeon]
MYKNGPGVASYRIGFSTGLFFLVAFLSRLAVAPFPASLNFGARPGGYPPTAQKAALAAIGGLYSLSGGMIIGRSLGVRRKWAEVAARANESIDPPVPGTADRAESIPAPQVGGARWRMGTAFRA